MNKDEIRSLFFDVETKIIQFMWEKQLDDHLWVDDRESKNHPDYSSVYRFAQLFYMFKIEKQTFNLLECGTSLYDDVNFVESGGNTTYFTIFIDSRNIWNWAWLHECRTKNAVDPHGFVHWWHNAGIRVWDSLNKFVSVQEIKYRMSLSVQIIGERNQIAEKIVDQLYASYRDKQYRKLEEQELLVLQQQKELEEKQGWLLTRVYKLTNRFVGFANAITWLMAVLGLFCGVPIYVLHLFWNFIRKVLGMT